MLNTIQNQAYLNKLPYYHIYALRDIHIPYICSNII